MTKEEIQELREWCNRERFMLHSHIIEKMFCEYKRYRNALEAISRGSFSTRNADIIARQALEE